MKNFIGWIIGIVVIYFIFSAIGSAFGGIGKYEGQSAEEWYNEYDESEAQVADLQDKVDGLQSALDEANSNIDDANSEIDSAKSYSGESYEEMEEAISNLDTVSTVDEPILPY